MDRIFDNLFLVYAIAAVVLYIVSYLLIHKRKLTGAVATISFFAVTLVGAHESAFQLMGRPRPTDVMYLSKPEVKTGYVLGLKPVKDDGIYVLLLEDGKEVPVLIKYPWDEANSQNLEQAMERSMKRFGRPDGFAIDMPFDQSLEDGPIPIYDLPQPALDKNKGNG